MSESPRKLSILGENAVLALVPLVGTYFVYVFQSSYLGFYGVPPSMIDVDVPKIIVSMMAIVFAATCYLILMAMVASYTSSQHPVVKILARQMLYVVFALPLILIGMQSFTFKQRVTWGIIFLLLAIPAYIPPRQKSGEKLTLLERLAKQEEQHEARLEKAPGSIRQAISDRLIAPFGALLFGTLYIALLGSYFASNDATHRFLVSKPDYLYVTKNGDALVFAQIDRPTKQLTGKLLVLAVGDAPTEMTVEKIGPLKRWRSAQRNDGAVQ